jgi:hypothetical protein
MLNKTQMIMNNGVAMRMFCLFGVKFHESKEQWLTFFYKPMEGITLIYIVFVGLELCAVQLGIRCKECSF